MTANLQYTINEPTCHQSREDKTYFLRRRPRKVYFPYLRIIIEITCLAMLVKGQCEHSNQNYTFDRAQTFPDYVRLQMVRTRAVLQALTASSQVTPEIFGVGLFTFTGRGTTRHSACTPCCKYGFSVYYSGSRGGCCG